MSRDALGVLAGIARELHADEIARDAESVAARTAENLFYVACVGQFKRGKSTLINALIGGDLLPTGVVPVTAAITIVRYGATPRVLARFAGGLEREIDRSAIADYVAEERNPGNRKQVQAIEINAPSPILASGMCLIDTPGLGSVFETNSETTRRFLPHIDAALVVLGADPPVSGEEASVIEQIARQVPDVLFVLNKADRLPEDDLAQAAAFTRAALEKRIGRPMQLLIVSAVQRGTRDWTRLEHRLAELALTEGAELVRAARDRAIRRIRAAVLHEIEEHRRALVVPLEETERRLAETQRRVDEAQRALDDVTFLFASEQQKLSREFARTRDAFLERVVATADDEESARTIASDAIDSWVAELEPAADQMFSASTERFATLLRDLGGLDLERHLARRRFYFTTLSELTGRKMFRKRDPQTYLRRLLETNSARVANDLIDRFVESRRQLEREVATSLREIGGGAERAARHARESLASGRQHIEAELSRLDELSLLLQRETQSS